MATIEFLYAVAWRPKGSDTDPAWACVKDEAKERTIPAVYIRSTEAWERAERMAEQFDDCEYRVVTLSIAVAPVCADGSLVHDFKGQERCPACGFEGITVGRHESVKRDEYCCRGECCGPGSWCCNRAGPHDHEELSDPGSCGAVWGEGHQCALDAGHPMPHASTDCHTVWAGDDR